MARSPFLTVVGLPLEGDATGKSAGCHKHEGAKDVFVKVAKFGRVRLACDEVTDRQIVEKCVTSQKKRIGTRWTKKTLVTGTNLRDQKITKVVPFLPTSQLSSIY